MKITTEEISRITEQWEKMSNKEWKNFTKILIEAQDKLNKNKK
jgi:hypothetical protein